MQSQTVAFDDMPDLIDNDGLHYYLLPFGYGGVQKRRLSDNQLVWSFTHGSGQQGPFGELNETLSSIHQNSDDSLHAMGTRGGSYLIDQLNGSGIRLNHLDTYHGVQIEPMSEGMFLKSNRPQQIMCPPIAPCPHAGQYFPLELVVQNHQNKTETLLYSRRQGGNTAQGRYIGTQFYFIPVVPTLSHWFLTPMLCGVIAVFARKQMIKQ